MKAYIRRHESFPNLNEDLKFSSLYEKETLSLSAGMFFVLIRRDENFPKAGRNQLLFSMTERATRWWDVQMSAPARHRRHQRHAWFANVLETAIVFPASTIQRDVMNGN